LASIGGNIHLFTFVLVPAPLFVLDLVTARGTK
jgi:hypothetical protein